MDARRLSGRARRAFTLVELLVVVLIVVLVSAVALPPVISAISHRQVSSAASQLQAALGAARDQAIRAGQPCGIRLLPASTNAGGILAYDSWVDLATPPDYSLGAVSIKPLAGALAPSPGTFAYNANQALNGLTPWLYPTEFNTYGTPLPYPSSALIIEAEPFNSAVAAGLVPNEPVNWWWNVRIGDKIQIGGDGNSYTVIGPCEVRPTNTANPAHQGNPELFVNVGLPGDSFTVSDPNGTAQPGTGDSPLARCYTNPVTNAVFLQPVQFLILVNGADDDGDGNTDNGWNGVDENLNGTPDDLAEWYSAAGTPLEKESWLGTLNPKSRRARAAGKPYQGMLYSITRRPVPTAGGKVTRLPANVVIDATTLGTTNERSRLPLDGANLVPNPSIDLMILPGGPLVPTTIYSNPGATTLAAPFAHFWLAERADVTAPVAPAAGGVNWLPWPAGTQGSGQSSTLRGDRMLLTLYTKTGQVVSNSLENFNPLLPNAPFIAAQTGTTEAK